MKCSAFEVHCQQQWLRLPTWRTSTRTWPFLAGELPCQVRSGHEQDLSLLNSHDCLCQLADSLEEELLAALNVPHHKTHAFTSIGCKCRTTSGKRVCCMNDT